MMMFMMICIKDDDDIEYDAMYRPRQNIRITLSDDSTLNVILMTLELVYLYIDIQTNN